VQDFMFANMNYPEEDSAFVESVTQKPANSLRG